MYCCHVPYRLGEVPNDALETDTFSVMRGKCEILIACKYIATVTKNPVSQGFFCITHFYYLRPTTDTEKEETWLQNERESLQVCEVGEARTTPSRKSALFEPNNQLLVSGLE